MLELLVGLPAVRVLGIADLLPSTPLVLHVETRLAGAPVCPGCGGPGRLKDRRAVELVDLPVFARRTRLVWRKRRWCCPAPECATGSWTEINPLVAPSRLGLTDRAGRWVTYQVGYHGRTVAEVAAELGCDWHTVNNAVVAYGRRLVDDPARIGTTSALGLDELLFVREGCYRHKRWATSIVDVAEGRLLDLVEGRDSGPAAEWLAQRGVEWRAQIRYAALDMSGPYRKVFNEQLPDATQVVDPFHLCKLAGEKLDEVRRRVQQQTTGHRGHKHDPLYRIRRLLVMAHERLGESSETKLRGLLAAGDPNGEVTVAWHAKEAVRALYSHQDPDLAVAWVDQLSDDLREPTNPPEIRQLGRTLRTWRTQIAAWHQARVTNARTETMNGLAKRIKRIAFGMTNFRNWRVRVLLYAGRPDWSKLPTVTP